MDRIDKSWTALVLIVTAALCFGFGASTRDGAVSSNGSVVEVVTVQNIPAYVNRWCLVRAGAPPAASANVAIVEFGEGRSRHRYAYPQTSSSSLAAHDTVSSEIDTCSITKSAARVTDASADIAVGR